jgi:plastocyanin
VIDGYRRVIMSRLLLVPLGALLLLLVGLVGAPTVLAGDPCYHGFDMPARSVGSDTQIKVAPCAFGPTVSYVATGSTVTFFTGPGFTHLITGANQEWGSRDVELQPNQTVSYRFDTPGIYPYACALHRGMSGTIVVGAASPPSGGSDTAPAANTTGSNTSDGAATGQGGQGDQPGTPASDAVRIAGAGVAGGLAGALLVFGILRRRAPRAA